jgi:hypothetical protein
VLAGGDPLDTCGPARRWRSARQAREREAGLRGRLPVGNAAPFFAPPHLLTCPVRGEQRWEERSR